MPRRSTTGAIYLLREMIEKYQSRRRELHMVFIDLEKAYDQDTKRCTLKSLENKGVGVAYIKAIQDICDGILTKDRIPGGETKDFPIRIDLHQGSSLSPYLFNLVVNVLIESVK